MDAVVFRLICGFGSCFDLFVDRLFQIQCFVFWLALSLQESHSSRNSAQER